MTDWTNIGTVAPTQLTSTRLQLHYASYVLASAAHSLLEHAADDSHSNLGFDSAHGSLATRPLAPGVALHLDLEAFSLVVRRDREALTSFPLDGQTLDQALAWTSELSAAGLGSTVSRREYPDFPSSPIMTGAAFAKPSAPELCEFLHGFGNAHQIIESLRADHANMSPARVWPHHFDLGVLLPLSEDGKVTIGLGFSPGDDNFDQPYYYCSPYPAPAAGTSLPELPAGHWITDGFTSAILTSTELLESASQQETTAAYAQGAVARCRELLQGAD